MSQDQKVVKFGRVTYDPKTRIWSKPEPKKWGSGLLRCEVYHLAKDELVREALYEVMASPNEWRAAYAWVKAERKRAGLDKF